ncbi:ATP-binding protein [Corynebacterium sp. MSK158]|uniref:AlbA family DNA-binding domain-containing protein n=1 Tax=Corynebacterium sp. MSK158 TaxID=3050212 RepID=UPI00254A969C|nr:ATP-binding protein [Corynebacterium sp. MSK158]MDK8694062.1 ATP-binding protein [Corynebacterium sp. MSK158]
MPLWDVKHLQDEDIAKIVDRLRSQGSDDGRVEAKAAVGKLNKDVWNTVSAFANTEGGLILLGVDESQNFAPAKGFDPNKTIDSLDNGLSGDSSKVDPSQNGTLNAAP